MERLLFLVVAGCFIATLSACPTTAWEPAPAPNIPVVPPPDDSIIKKDEGGEFFDEGKEPSDAEATPPEAPPAPDASASATPEAPAPATP